MGKFGPKFVAIAMSVALALFSVAGLSGCATESAEDMITAAISGELDAYKNMEDSVMTDIASKVEEQGLQTLGIEGQDFATAILDGFDYSIDNVEVNGDTAVATITIVSKSYSGFEAEVQNIVQDMLSNSADFAGKSTEEVQAALGERVMAAFESIPVSTEQVQIEYKLEGNTWEPVNAQEVLGSMDSVVFMQSAVTDAEADDAQSEDASAETQE